MLHGSDFGDVAPWSTSNTESTEDVQYMATEHGVGMVT